MFGFLPGRIANRNQWIAAATSCVVIAAAAAMVAANSGYACADEAAGLEKKLTEKLQAMQCPGALVGIFPDEGEPRRFVLGVADVDTKTPMTADVHMRVGSVFKPILGTVVLQLYDEGKLSLDDPVSKYVPDVPNGDKITLRMLGKNTSGLFNSIENKELQYAIMKDPTKQWTPAEILAFNAGREPYCQPGEKWRYSNTNAVLLGLCIEKATGRTFAEEIEERICKPLRLTETGVPKVAELPLPRTAAYRNGYPDKVIGYGNVFYNVSNYSAAWTGAAGNLYSTLDDLGKAAKPIATGVLLKEAGREELHDWIATGHEGVEYGYFLYRKNGGIGHTGDVPGFNAVMMYYPEQKAAIVVLTNLSNNADGTMPAEELAKLVAENIKAKGSR